jgi:hypothetical protein
MFESFHEKILENGYYQSTFKCGKVEKMKNKKGKEIGKRERTGC